MSYIKLDGHLVNQTYQGLTIAAIGQTFHFDNGTVVEFPTPFVPVGDPLVIVPVVVKDGDTGLRVDLTRWCPGHVGNGLTAVLPVDVPGQALAARIAKAFHADPATTWRDSVGQVIAWLRVWAPANGVRLNGLDDTEVPT